MAGETFKQEREGLRQIQPLEVKIVEGGGGGPEVVGIKDIIGEQINPAREDGNLALIKTDTSNLDVPLSTRAPKPSHISVSQSLTADQNTSGLTLSLDLDGRKSFSVLIDLPNDDSAEAWIYTSDDNVDFDILDIVSFKRKYFGCYNTNFRYTKVEVPTTGIQIKAKLTAI
ncbi:MAG: hypothetical protein QXS37_04490 [Candidatus Aenigmatarchaeota archaeon]